MHVVTHPWKLQCYHVDLAGYSLACPEFSEITNCQYIWKGLSDFIDFSHVCMFFAFFCIHWSYKNMLFWAGIVSHRLSANQIVRCFKLKEHNQIPLLINVTTLVIQFYSFISYLFRSVLQNFAKVIGKYLRWSSSQKFADYNLTKKGLHQRFYPMQIKKIFRTASSKITFGECFCLESSPCGGVLSK